MLIQCSPQGISLIRWGGEVVTSTGVGLVQCEVPVTSSENELWRGLELGNFIQNGKAFGIRDRITARGEVDVDNSEANKEEAVFVCWKKKNGLNVARDDDDVLHTESWQKGIMNEDVGTTANIAIRVRVPEGGPFGPQQVLVNGWWTFRLGLLGQNDIGVWC